MLRLSRNCSQSAQTIPTLLIKSLKTRVHFLCETPWVQATSYSNLNLQICFSGLICNDCSQFRIDFGACSAGTIIGRCRERKYKGGQAERRQDDESESRRLSWQAVPPCSELLETSGSYF